MPKKLKKNIQFRWYKDDFADINKIKVVVEIESFIELTKKYQHLDSRIFDLKIPKKDKLFSISEFQEYRKISNELVQKYASKENCGCGSHR